MPSLQMLPVALRRLLARRPWIHWLVVLTAAVATGATLRERVDAIDDARRAWGDAREVLVARRDTRPGEPLDVDVREVPSASRSAGRPGTRCESSATGRSPGRVGRRDRDGDRRRARRSGGSGGAAARRLGGGADRRVAGRRRADRRARCRSSGDGVVLARRCDRRRVPRRRHARRCAGGRGGDGRGRRPGRRRRPLLLAPVRRQRQPEAAMQSTATPSSTR